MSDDRKSSLWPWIVALLIGLPVMYVGSYALLVHRTSWVGKIPFPGDDPVIFDRPPYYSATIPKVGYFSIGEDGWGRVFAPIHRLDRKLRPEHWTLRIDPQ